MTDKELARRMKIRFRKFDASLYAKAHRPEDYGIMLTNEAKEEERRILRESGIKVPVKRVRKEREDLPKLTIRLPRSEYLELQRVKTERGIKTDNLIINKAIETALVMWGRR